MTTVEVNFDGLIGPTHNYAGLSIGNLASVGHAGVVAHPKAAALQGLAKMKLLLDLGLVQGILPPQERPAIRRLRELGFQGTDEAVLERAWATDPALVARVSSASSMWAANAATVCPEPDTADGRVHITPANLLTMPHRAIECLETARALAHALPDPEYVVLHPPLPTHADFADEGAANHVRLCSAHGERGVEIFVYGRSAYDRTGQPVFPARQTLQASQAIARRAGLEPRRTLFVRQSPAGIDAGAFHADVVAVGTESTLLFHETAFVDKRAVLDAIRRAADGLFEPELIEVPEADVPIADAVRSYLFNAQLLRIPGTEKKLLLAPLETIEVDSSRAFCDRLLASGASIGEVRHTDLRQSMQNGGGPACLRLRVVLNVAALERVNPSLLLDQALHARLVSWVDRHYRDALVPDDLGDRALLRESREALDELTRLLGLGGDYYGFQRC
ncbi:MAG: N-succinylarginine dihydrolase [Polyangiaceae bacterium]|nr:N-succinylarginine dihydrolase [Polyangiaceae bacterium]